MLCNYTWSKFETIHKRYIDILGLPISKIEYPAITICSQGWISTVTERAMNYQFLTYAESKGFDVANMTAQEIDTLKQALLLGKLTLPYVEFMTKYCLV